MGLRRTENGCQYLGEDDLCTIYDHRPVTCRRYPFDVEMDEQENIELLSISDSVECPYELDGYHALGEIKALCVWEEEEENPYFEKIEIWNKKKKTGKNNNHKNSVNTDTSNTNNNGHTDNMNSSQNKTGGEKKSIFSLQTNFPQTITS